MMGADMIMSWASDDEVTVLDLNSTGIYGPHPLMRSLEAATIFWNPEGDESNGWTVIEFKRRIISRDPFDKSFLPGQTIDIIWSMSSSDSLATRHNVRGESSLTFG